MEPITIGLLGIAAFLVLLTTGMRIAFSGFVAGFIGLIYLNGWEAAVEIFRSQAFSQSIKFEMSVIPLFVLMGYFGYHADIGKEIFQAAQKCIGQLPGGLAMATTGACALFGAITGSSPATAALFSKLAIPEMDKYNYSKMLSVGTVAASGTLATLIPPSTNMVIYGSLTEQSIGKLLIAGVIPGIISAVVFCIGIYIRVLFNPALGPRGPRTSLREKIGSLGTLWSVAVVFGIVIGGLYMGTFTPTEAGAIGAVAIFVIALLMGRLTVKKVKDSMWETAQISCMIFFIIIGIKMFTVLLVASGVTDLMVEWAVTLPPNLLLLGVIIMYLIFGCFIGVLGMLVSTLPFVFPTMMAAGFDPIWFGILVIVLCEVAMLTPPVGINCYVTSNVTGVPLEKVFASIVPYLVYEMIIIGILILFPDLVTFLPRHMYK